MKVLRLMQVSHIANEQNDKPLMVLLFKEYRSDISYSILIEKESWELVNARHSDQPKSNTIFRVVRIEIYDNLDLAKERYRKSLNATIPINILHRLSNHLVKFFEVELGLIYSIEM